MQDTSPDFRRLVSERMRAIPPHERVRLCMEMFETARRLIEASLPPGLDPLEHRRLLAERLYGDLARKAFGASTRPPRVGA